jgi:hypothetical protein
MTPQMNLWVLQASGSYKVSLTEIQIFALKSGNVLVRKKYDKGHHVPAILSLTREIPGLLSLTECT